MRASAALSQVKADVIPLCHLVKTRVKQLCCQSGLPAFSACMASRCPSFTPTNLPKSFHFAGISAPMYSHKLRMSASPNFRKSGAVIGEVIGLQPMNKNESIGVHTFWSKCPFALTCNEAWSHKFNHCYSYSPLTTNVITINFLSSSSTSLLENICLDITVTNIELHTCDCCMHLLNSYTMCKICRMWLLYLHFSR